ncbi:DJ-1/PfpI family protein [Halovivax limisalsi]|uniref:DJ-1/PfpI family protein n=1 Tax=Halovivax limisalsi TaxID=1453760 RepID=UPI001FFDE15F|nr:DJ-1/PfpI family protein [Halovivax limisalsi]
MSEYAASIVLFDGFDELDAIGPYEVFETAAEFGADIDTALVTTAARDRVTAGHGLRVEADGVLATPGASAELPDLLVVPGGGWTSDDGAVRRVVDAGDLPRRAAELHAAGVTVASICTGAMILAAAGLLDARPAVTHRDALADLANAGAEIPAAAEPRDASPVIGVDDGDVLTAGGVTTGIDLACWLVEREFGADLAESVATELEHERRGEIVR